MNSPHIGHSFGIPASYSRGIFLTTRGAASIVAFKVFRPRRSDSSRVALETLEPHERAYRRSFADEVAIDFPSSRAAGELFRRDHVAPEASTATAHAEITISPDQAFAGAMVSLDVNVPRTCSCCGGRGEVWSEPCEPCHGRGQALQAHRLTVAVPPGVGQGDRFSFNVWLPRGPRTRVDVRVAITHLR